jgi:hypothetical protein
MRSKFILHSAILSVALAGFASAQQQSPFTFSYILSADRNLVPISPGGTIVFPPTKLNAISQALLNITNNGSTDAVISNVTISGSAFAFQSLPSFPVRVNTGLTLQLLVTYQPSGTPPDAGQIQISFPESPSVTINLQGTLSAPNIVYAVIEGGQTTTITPGATVPLPDTNVGASSSVVIQVRNTGNLSAVITTIVLNGQDFQLSGVPALPQTLQPSGRLTFTVTFTPTAAVVRQANLSIGTDSFTLTGKGLGPKLVFSYSSAGSTVTLGTGDSVVFSPIQISQSGQATFFVQNTGTVTATIFNIGIAQPNSPFSVSGLPPLPLKLDPGAQSSFNIVFAPITTGFANGTLQLDTATVGLLGSGTPPPPLPSYSIQGPTGNVAAASQPTVSLKLSRPYPVAIAGTLTLTTSGSLPSDPSVQFSTGGRTAAFVIPANGTDANFAGQGPNLQLQTGTVAGAITVTPSFATEAGGVNLTPNAPSTLEFSVASSAPTLTAISVGSSTTNSFVLSLTGFSTTRSLTGLSVQFTAAAGFNVPAAAVNIDLQQAAGAWFASTASVAFGGQFSVSVPFTLHGTVSSTQTLIQTIASISASVTNGTGTSNTLQTNVQ